MKTRRVCLFSDLKTSSPKRRTAPLKNVMPSSRKRWFFSWSNDKKKKRDRWDLFGGKVRTLLWAGHTHTHTHKHTHTHTHTHRHTLSSSLPKQQPFFFCNLGLSAGWSREWKKDRRDEIETSPRCLRDYKSTNWTDGGQMGSGVNRTSIPQYLVGLMF